jgi:hypothetical protein
MQVACHGKECLSNQSLAKPRSRILNGTVNILDTPIRRIAGQYFWIARLTDAATHASNKIVRIETNHA